MTPFDEACAMINGPILTITLLVIERRIEPGAQDLPAVNVSRLDTVATRSGTDTPLGDLPAWLALESGATFGDGHRF